MTTAVAQAPVQTPIRTAAAPVDRGLDPARLAAAVVVALRLIAVRTAGAADPPRRTRNGIGTGFVGPRSWQRVH